MYIVYMDESGDDGFPKYSSPFFILTSLYMHYQNWKSNFEKIYGFRKKLKNDYNFPVKMEFHTAGFLTDKYPYRDLRYSFSEKKDILFLFFDLLSILDIRIINTVMNKKNITYEKYDVLDKTLNYNVQRIENDIRSIDQSGKFMIITDEGRVPMMTRTTRKMQKYNYIPSKFNPQPYKSEIQKLIEDPLPKSSSESYFIQLADMVSYIVNLYAKREFLINESWPNRILNVLKEGDEIELLNTIKPVLNLQASSVNDYGIAHYPKKK